MHAIARLAVAHAVFAEDAVHGHDELHVVGVAGAVPDAVGGFVLELVFGFAGIAAFDVCVRFRLAVGECGGVGPRLRTHAVAPLLHGGVVLFLRGDVLVHISFLFFFDSSMSWLRRCSTVWTGSWRYLSSSWMLSPRRLRWMFVQENGCDAVSSGSGGVSSGRSGLDGSALAS